MSTQSESNPRAVLHDIDLFYLRDSCTCPKCVDISTRQKLFETSDIPTDLTYKDHQWMRNGQLQITWDKDIEGYEDHRSIFEPNFLESAESIQQRREACYNTWKRIAWNREDIKQNSKLITFSYTDYMNKGEVFWQAIESLHVYGLVFVKDVPLDERAVKDIAECVGPLKNTFYGMTWDVKSIPSAKNVAYTSNDLDFHMDLLYFADPPGVQFLHVLKQSTAGGESRFSDAVAAFERLQNEYPELVESLVNFPVTYHYKNAGHWMQQTRYFLEGGIIGRGKPASQRYAYPLDYESINWAPPFQGPMERADVFDSAENYNTPRFKDYILAAKKFKELISEESAVYETLMGDGVCAIFNNRRVLHARKPFSSTEGGRWLKGCYVDGDYLRDKYRVLKDSRLRARQGASDQGLT